MILDLIYVNNKIGFYCRTLFMNGVETTEFIISIQRQMLIHTMPNVAFSFLMWVGCSWKNTLK